MGIGASFVLIAVGAILDWGITLSDTHGFNLHTIGVILMIVGLLGLVLSLIFWGRWGGFGGYRRRQVVDGPTGRRVYEDEVV